MKKFLVPLGFGLVSVFGLSLVPLADGGGSSLTPVFAEGSEGSGSSGTGGTSSETSNKSTKKAKKKKRKNASGTAEVDRERDKEIATATAKALKNAFGSKETKQVSYQSYTNAKTMESMGVRKAFDSPFESSGEKSRALADAIEGVKTQKQYLSELPEETRRNMNYEGKIQKMDERAEIYKNGKDFLDAHPFGLVSNISPRTSDNSPEGKANRAQFESLFPPIPDPHDGDSH